MESEVKPGENLKVKIKIADVEFSAEGDKDFCDRNLKEFIESLETIFKAKGKPHPCSLPEWRYADRARELCGGDENA